MTDHLTQKARAAHAGMLTAWDVFVDHLLDAERAAMRDKLTAEGASMAEATEKGPRITLSG